MIDEGLARASDTLLFAAVIAYVVAMFGYFVELSFGRLAPRPIAGGAVDTVPAPVAAAVAAPSRVPRLAGRVAVVATVVGLLLHVASAVTRGLAVDRVPWGNMYEFSSMVSLFAVVAWLGVIRRHPLRHLGGFVMLPVILYLGVAALVLYAPAAPLVPALNSYWIKIHVVGAMASSGIFMVGFVAAALYLWRSWRDRRAPDKPSRLPSAATLDRVSYRVHAFGFPVWTFTVMAGAVWAEAAWGRYWGWDPKETWSFVTWVVYAGYLHARSTAGWRGRRAAWIAVAGFASLMVTYYVVNIWVSGLHSYAGV
ncbi:MAG TPA: c-type cytochrome biogenesis protein CcsB [Frankiaceae bacterium]|nr:c-type cytochrome biogenesis protein CcsB [Frankiaceae bacterium]